jgi:O-antigen/teichoic acid export membrane protein
VVVSNFLTFASTILVANFIDPSAFGQLGLLLFLTGLMTLLFTLASKQGTMKRTFGGDDDDDDDEEDEDLAADPRRTLGTGLVLIGLVSIFGTLITVTFAGPVAEWLLGDGADPKLVVWAAVAGGAGAVYRVASITIWLERRPYPYIAVEAARPLLTLIAVVPLMVAGTGLEGAIAGTALGSALATVFALLLLRGSWNPCFYPSEALATPTSAPTTWPRGRGSWSRSCPPATARRCALCRRRRLSVPPRTSMGSEPPAGSSSATSC